MARKANYWKSETYARQSDLTMGTRGERESTNLNDLTVNLAERYFGTTVPFLLISKSDQSKSVILRSKRAAMLVVFQQLFDTGEKASVEKNFQI